MKHLATQLAPRLVPPPRAGLSLVEISIALTVLLIALQGFARTIVGSGRALGSEAETVRAGEAARALLEELRSADFTEVFALYNENPDDDPDGPGSAPGAHLPVAGLDPRPNDPDGMVARIVFPTGFDPLGGLTLREDVQLDSLGMPRDLNGDGVLDGEPHADDYVLLPVVVRLEWRGASGPGALELRTILGGSR